MLDMLLVGLPLIVCIFWGVFVLTTDTYSAGSLLPNPKFQAFDSNGDPLSGGLLYTYEPGTTTNKATYSDKDLTTPNANPVVLDSRGEATVYLDGSTKLLLKTSDGTTIWTMDNVQTDKGPSYTASPAGYIAVFNSTSSVSGIPELSGASLTSVPNSKLPNPLTNDLNASEALGGASAYGIHGNMTLSGLQLAGRVGEINATSPPIVNIGDGSSGVTELVIGHDITTAGNDSGVTYFSPAQQIYEGAGSSRTSGNTIFVISGNTGFTIVMKRTSIGWEVMSCNATVRRP